MCIISFTWSGSSWHSQLSFEILLLNRGQSAPREQQTYDLDRFISMSKDILETEIYLEFVD